MPYLPKSLYLQTDIQKSIIMKGQPKHKRWIYLVTTYVLTVSLFVIAKAGFMTYQSGEYPLSFSDLSAVVWHGLSLDLSTSIYLILFPFLIIISLWWNGWKWLRPVLSGYNLLVSLALSIIFVSDASLYEFWHFRLSASVLEYLENPSGITQSVSWGFLLVRLLAIICLTALIFQLYQKLLPRQLSPLSLSRRIASSCLSLLLVGPLLIGIRGGISESTTNVGQVYFSQTQYLNHAAVNPLFSFLSSFEHGEKDYFIYHYFSEAECQQLTDRVYTTESILSDTLLRTKRPNVAVILLEGCGAIFTRLEGQTQVMPHFNRLMDEGVNFTNCYGNSWRTDRGTVCTLSGYPSFPNVSVMKMPDKSQTMPSIAASLKKCGYKTSYLYGGDINFTNMRSYLVATGFETLYSMSHFSKEEQKTAKWGVRDDITFDALARLIEQPHDKPFLIGYSTLSSHEPWDVPTHQLQDPVLNAFHYLDGCIGTLVSRLKQSEAWNDLLLILIPDHGISYGEWDNTKPARNHIPMLWLGGAIRQARTIPTLCNQSDLAATLLGQMGIPHQEFTFSRDILSKSYVYPTAMNTFTSGFLFTDSTGHIVYDLDFKQFTSKKGNDSQRLLQTGKAILQRTSTDLKNR